MGSAIVPQSEGSCASSAADPPPRRTTGKVQWIFNTHRIRFTRAVCLHVEPESGPVLMRMFGQPVRSAELHTSANCTPVPNCTPVLMLALQACIPHAHRPIDLLVL